MSFMNGLRIEITDLFKNHLKQGVDDFVNLGYIRYGVTGVFLFFSGYVADIDVT